MSPSTYAVDYRKYRNHIASFPTKTLDDAIAIRDSMSALPGKFSSVENLAVSDKYITPLAW
ncbi:hypothetical protein [Nostoc sp.]|uniref:hypothetical protein n=1 Tax=Nostoc sp. TaxID=1180 RepID=UPI002FF8977B